MAPETLDFEEPIAILLKEIEALTLLPRTDAREREIGSLRRRIESVRAELYRNLTPWQRVQVARHPNRPGLDEYIARLFPVFVEIHGDRRFADDHAIVTGFAEYHGQPVLLVAHDKGSDTKEKIFRNFGYARPEGYRKALRAMRLAEKFHRPIIAFVDTPAAYPGIDSEERGVAEAQATARENGWGPGGPKPIEPDTSIGGIVATVRPLKTKKGDRMAVFTLEDSGGSVEIVVFPDAFGRCGQLIEVGALVLVRGKLERDDETTRILASEIAPIDTVRERLAREVSIHLRKPADRTTLEALGAIFSRHRGDRKVSFEVETGEAPHRLRVRVDVSSQIRVRPSPALIQDIEQVVGAGAVELR